MSDDRFFDEFAEDFFAESSDHVATIRRIAMVFEDRSKTGEVVPPTQLAELLRSLHTLKGLCGMVGLNSAGSIAHALEETLRDAHIGQRGVSAEMAETMFAAARMLEQCLATHRAGTPAPDISGIIHDLQHLSHQPEVESSRPRTSADARQQYSFTFAPSAELNARGVTVEVARTRLQSLGTVVSVMPRVAQSGAIQFEFNVLVEPGREPLPEWRDDAIDWHVVDAPVPLASAEIKAAAALPKSNLVRVELNRLDDLMLLVGELVMSRARLADAVLRLDANRSNAAVLEVSDVSEIIERQLRDLRGAVMRVRLVRVGEVFERMRFVARDVASETGKQARVMAEGGATEIDKVVVERMLEPLLHLVRNAISHGIESPATRADLGKDPIGLITLTAESAGDEIVIRVRDDGRGIDVDAIRAAARDAGVPQKELENASLLDVLCLPGLSTQTAADLASGRGVGMAVVRSTVKELGGDLAVSTEAGTGTLFTIRLPLTLMIVDALLVNVAEQVIAVPQPALREVLQVETKDFVTFENNEVISYRGGVLPVVRLRSLFARPAGTGNKSIVLVVGADQDIIGLVVDRIVGLREIVVRSLGDPLVAVPGIAGAAELSDGTISLILDTPGLVRYAAEHKRNAQQRRIKSFDALQHGRSA